MRGPVVQAETLYYLSESQRPHLLLADGMILLGVGQAPIMSTTVAWSSTAVTDSGLSWSKLKPLFYTEY